MLDVTPNMMDGGRVATRNSKADVPRTTKALTAGEVPVTHVVLAGVRTELLQRIDQAREEAKADIQKLDAKIDAVRADVHEVKAAMHAMDAKLSRIEVLVEEQNARNKIVLDGITALLARQDQLEQRVSRVEDTVRELAAVRRSN